MGRFIQIQKRCNKKGIVIKIGVMLSCIILVTPVKPAPDVEAFQDKLRGIDGTFNIF